SVAWINWKGSIVLPDETSSIPTAALPDEPTSVTNSAADNSVPDAPAAAASTLAPTDSAAAQDAKPRKKAGSVSYADAGVDITSGEKSKQRIKMLARKTFNKNV